MEQLLLHLTGDYLLQNDWMALNKKESTLQGVIACTIHCVIYTLPFMLLGLNVSQLLIIFWTHFILDRTNIVTWLLSKRNNCDTSNFGFGKNRPPFISVWLNIITDNTLHLISNYLIIKYLGGL